MLLGICGFAGSGKTTVSNMLVQNHEYNQIAFADTVKDVTSVLFGWPRDLLEGDTPESRLFRETPDKFWSARLDRIVTPRWALQIMGTEAGRDAIHENIWIFCAEAKIKDHENVIISDARFPNEIKFIREKGGYVIRVVRGSEPVWYETAYNHMVHDKYLMHQKYPEIHTSEWAWIGTDFDYVIYNNGSIEELQEKVKYALTTLQIRDTFSHSKMVNQGDYDYEV